MIPKFQNYEEGFGAELRCPHCGNTYLHHTSVEVFGRKDDAENGAHLTVCDETVAQNDDMADNPSSRRQGVLIHLKCEKCGKDSILTVAQHKGRTLIDID